MFVVVCVEGGDVLLLGRLVLEPGRTKRAAVWSLFRVGPSMSGELLPCNKSDRANVAPIGLHTVVGLLMLVVARYLAKRGTALLTLADHLYCVDAFVYSQATTLCERLPADVAHIRPESTMCPAVSGQMSKQSKRLATVATPEWPFPRVCSVMTDHIAHFACGVLAPLTLSVYRSCRCERDAASSASPDDPVPGRYSRSGRSGGHAFTWGAQEYSVAASSRAVLTEFGSVK